MPETRRKPPADALLYEFDEDFRAPRETSPLEEEASFGSLGSRYFFS